MSYAALIPDRRRKHFPLGGGPRPTKAQRKIGRAGIAAARKVLAKTNPDVPDDDHQLVAHTPEQTRRARRGIARMRAALEEEEVER